MAKFEKQLHASQKFLAGLTGLPHFSELREKQLQACLKVLDGLPSLSTSTVANWLDILDFSIWGPEGAAKLQTAMAIKETAGETPGATGRRSLQDYTELPRFIPADLWNVLLGSETGRDGKLALLAQHCAKLGLRCPSEPTCALILTLAYCSAPEPRVLEEREWYDQLKIKKPVIKKHLTGSAPAEYLLTLPSDVLGLPVGIRMLAFPNELQAAPVPPSIVELMQLMRAHPMRSTSRFATPQLAPKYVSQEPKSPVGKAYMQALGVMAKFFKSGYSRDLHEQGEDDMPNLTYFKHSTRGSKPATLLALQDAPQEAAEKGVDGLPPADESQPLDAAYEPAAVVVHLKESLSAAKTEASFKRPAAAAASAAAAFKRPAAAAASAAAAFKRPAAASSDMQPRRTKTKWSKLPPLALREAFLAGCSKCRWAANCTPSCWRDRGY